MSGFEADWLALRAPADTAARNPDLLDRLADWASAKPDLSILDLGCGTGATLRAISPRLVCRQHWLLVDTDQDLLRRCPESHDTVEVATLQLDLAADLDLLPSESVDLVTCSALLDLVSQDWLERVASQFSKAALYLALTVDGRITFDPGLPEDEEVLDLVARHHRRDKSFGPALGYEAAQSAAQILRRIGHEVHLAAADWRLGPEQSRLICAVADGYGEAALEQSAPQDATAAERIRRWRQARHDLPDQRLTVGHLDLLSLPEPRRA